MSRIGWIALGVIGVVAVVQAAQDVNANEIDYSPYEPYDGMLPDNSANANEWIGKMKRWKAEKTWTNPVDSLNNALADFWENVDGSNDTTEQEELLQLSRDGDSQSIGWRYN